MKPRHLLIFLTLFLVSMLSIPLSFAQDSPQWHLPEGAKLRLGKGNMREIAYSPDGRHLAVASGIGIWIYDASTGNEIDLLTGHTGSVNSVAFSPNGQTLATGSRDDTIRLWDVRTGNEIDLLTGHTNTVFSVAFSPNGQTLATGSWREIRLWDVSTGNEIRTITGHTSSVSSVAFSPNGQTLASGSSDNTIRLWDANTGREIRIGHTGRVVSVAFSPNGQTLASGGRDDTIRLWDVNTGREIRILTGHTDYVNSIAFSPDGQTLASGSLDKTIRLWDVNTGNEIRTLTGHPESIRGVAFSPDGNTLASGSWQEIRLWDVGTGNEIRTITGHTDWVESVAFSPNGNTLASGSWDGTVLLWTLTPDTPARVPTPIPEPTPEPSTGTRVSLSASPAHSPGVGQQITVSVNIANGEKVSGYQATVSYDTTALRYVESANGDYLPAGAFFIPAVAEGNKLRLAGTSLAGESNGAGTLATITFEVVAVKASTLGLSNVLLTEGSGKSSTPETAGTEITEQPAGNPADVNADGIVNIIDLTLVAANFGKTGTLAADVNGDKIVNIVDLTLVAAAFRDAAAAPEAWELHAGVTPTRATVEHWLREARQLNLANPAFHRGISVLEQLLATLTPKETTLLPNYPNPFNPETWFPYQLSAPADVTISIYTVDGKLVRRLALGHQPVGLYKSRSRAAYWDGKNALGEPVASGLYFYTFTAGEFTQTRKMLIRK